MTKLNPTGTALVYSTYLGGTKERAGNNFPTSSRLWNGAVVPLRE